MAIISDAMTIRGNVKIIGIKDVRDLSKLVVLAKVTPERLLEIVGRFAEDKAKRLSPQLKKIMKGMEKRGYAAIAIQH